MLRRFKRILSRATCEEDIHAFLKESDLLRWAFGKIWVFSKHPLGSEFVTDFILVATFSEGLHVWAVELESPRYESAFTVDGRPSRPLASALGQVGDWFQWIQQNQPFFLKTLRAAINPTFSTGVGMTA
jgi:hypothetical protein